MELRRYLLLIIGYYLLAASALAQGCPQWSLAKAKQEIDRLQQQLQRWDNAYFRQGINLVDDSVTSCFTEQRDCQQQFLARLSYLSSPSILGLGLTVRQWQLLIDAQQLPHLFAWLTLSYRQSQAILGASAAKQFQAHQQRSRQYSFIHWLQALGFPLRKTEYQALSQLSWPQLDHFSLQQWQQHLAITGARAQRLSAFIKQPAVQSLAHFLHQQGIAGFTGSIKPLTP